VPGPPPEHPRLRLLKGNPGERPARSPPEPARTEQCPEPPEHLKGYAREAWLHLAPELHKLNLLTTLDIAPFSAYCCAYAHWHRPKRSCSADDQDCRRPSPHQPAGADGFPSHGRHAAIGAEFGLSPNARLRLSGITPLPPPSTFDGLIK
jgi:P27 family predicted phage terminase small subunit